MLAVLKSIGPTRVRYSSIFRLWIKDDAVVVRGVSHVTKQVNERPCFGRNRRKLGAEPVQYSMELPFTDSFVIWSEMAECDATSVLERRKYTA
jgi:hypothetical protein